MYLGSDIVEQGAPLSNQNICHDNFFGKIKHQTDIPIDSFLSWNIEGSKHKNPQPKPTNYNWPSDSRYTYQSYLLLSPNFPLPSSAYHPKPIPENDPELLEQISIENSKKKLNTNLKLRENSHSHSPKATKQTSGRFLHKKTLKKQANMEKYKHDTRSMPDSRFKTYFKKPVFANYGHANKSPIYGGFLYGNYMKSYNAAPHEGNINPSKMEILENDKEKDMKKIDEVKVFNRKCKDWNKVPCFEVENKLKQGSNVLTNGKNMEIKDIDKPDLLEKKASKNDRKSATDDKNIEKIIANWHENDENISGKGKTLLKKSYSAKEILVSQVLSKNPTNKKNNKEQSEKTTQPVIKSQSSDKNKSINIHNEISTANHSETALKVPPEPKNQSSEAQKYCPRCSNKLHKSNKIQPSFRIKQILPLELLQKNKKILPIQHPEEIRAAGKLTNRSLSAYTLIFESSQF